jgi:hypothetical protein
MLVVLFGVAWLVGAVGAAHVSIEAVVALGLMLLGAAMVITGRTDWSLSRRSWPVWLGAGLILVLVATSSTFGVGGAVSSVHFGDMNPGVSSEGGKIHGGFGKLTVDAGVLAAGRTLQVDSVAGQTIVYVPRGTAVNARVLAGQICVNGSDKGDGVGASANVPINTGGDRRVVDIHQVFGQILVDYPGAGTTQACRHD